MSEKPLSEKPLSEKPLSERSWYHDGLKFKCSQCGDCCTGAPGFVWVNKQEMEALARRFDLPLDEFQARYVREIGVRKSLIEFDNGDCVFFDPEGRKCTVYEDRPRQCRTWPFWESNLRTPEAWRQTCEVCPGSGQGKVHTEAEIVERLKVIRV